MFVSCLCPTYDRVPVNSWLLEEAIESFLRQDYPADSRELIVYNDNKSITLLADDLARMNVIVVNDGERSPSLGDKYNRMVAMATGDLLAPWEDDDISLPWRLSTSVRALADSGASYYNPRRYWFHAEGKLHNKHSQGVGHACSMYTRRAFRIAGGYPPLSGAQDMEMDSRLVKSVPSCGWPGSAHELRMSRWFYIHRWDTGSTHLSAMGQKWYINAACGGETLAYNLRPHWRNDYVKLTLERL